VKSESLGKRAKCPKCGVAFVLAEDRPTDELADLEALAGGSVNEAEQIAYQVKDTPVYAQPRATAHRQTAPTASAPQSTTSALGEMWTIRKIVGTVLLLAVIVGGYGVKWYMRSERRADREASRLESSSSGSSRVQTEPLPEDFWDRPQPRSGPVRPMLTQLIDGRREARGMAAVRTPATQLRLILPPGNHAPQSVPCVFIAPAGSTLLTGVEFSEDEYEDYFPLLERGMALCFYTLDGSTFDETSEASMNSAVLAYAKSRGGVNNLQDAIDSVLTLSVIDPNRLATAGHSSAGTIAIIGAANEPRISRVAAMAPAIDVMKRVGSFVNGRAMAAFLKHMSPINVSLGSAKVFVYHCQDDDNTPASEAQAFASRNRGNVTLKMGREGGHVGAYYNGLPEIEEWLASEFKLPARKAADGNAAAPRTPEPAPTESAPSPAPTPAPSARAPDPVPSESARTTPPATPPVATPSDSPTPEVDRQIGPRGHGPEVVLDCGAVKARIRVPNSEYLGRGSPQMVSIGHWQMLRTPRWDITVGTTTPALARREFIVGAPADEFGKMHVLGINNRPMGIRVPDGEWTTVDALGGVFSMLSASDSDRGTPTFEVMLLGQSTGQVIMIHIRLAADGEKGLPHVLEWLKTWRMVVPPGRKIEAYQLGS
jgi:hypothetical protein